MSIMQIKTYSPEFLKKKNDFSMWMNWVMNGLMVIGTLLAFVFMYFLFNTQGQPSHQLGQQLVVHRWDNMKEYLTPFLVVFGTVDILLMVTMVFESHSRGYKELSETEYMKIWDQLNWINKPELTAMVKNVFKAQSNKLIRQNDLDLEKLPEYRKEFNKQKNLQELVKSKFEG